MTRQRALAAWAFLPLVSLIVGCGSPEQAELTAHRQRLLLPEAPAEVQSVADAKAAVTSQPDVVVQGQVEVESVPGSGPAQAIFVLAELQPDRHGDQPGHVADNCPFCKRRAAEAPRVTVQLVDEEGKVLPYSVQQLFGLKRGDVVVVRGRGEVVPELNLFTLTATGVHKQNANGTRR